MRSKQRGSSPIGPDAKLVVRGPLSSLQPNQVMHTPHNRTWGMFLAQKHTQSTLLV
jgi:hypothetical protein